MASSSSSSSSSSTTTQPTQPLSFLLRCGTTIAALHRELKQQNIDELKIDHLNVFHERTKQLIKDLTMEKQKVDQPFYYLDEKGWSKVIENVHDMIHNEIISKINHDKNKQLIEQFKGLLEELDELISKVDHLRNKQKQNESSTRVLSQASPCYYENNQGEFEEVYKKLSTQMRKCASFCFSFFSKNRNFVDIRKAELIHWWIGMDFVHDYIEGESVLNELVAYEFIIMLPRKPPSFHKRYTMDKVTINCYYNMNPPPNDLEFIPRIKKVHGRLFITYDHKEISKSEKVALFNMSAFSLNLDDFFNSSWFNLDKAKVIHLGSWHSGMDYVVVQGTLKDLGSLLLKEYNYLRFLSFQGMSGIEELPQSIYKLSTLKVLDLKACQDLRRLFGHGIESLKGLMCLDLSECYLLEGIPKNITSLENLRVLKGFKINDELDSESKDVKHYATFQDLSRMKNLIKLSIRTRKMEFPTNKDVHTLRQMNQLKKLQITWVQSASRTIDVDKQTNREVFDEEFPSSLEKLQLVAAPETIISRLLQLVCNSPKNKLKKLCIIGGGIWKIDPSKCCFPQVKNVRLRRLPKLHNSWNDFRLLFPKLTSLEMFECPNLIFFPCDENGFWEESESYW